MLTNTTFILKWNEIQSRVPTINYIGVHVICSVVGCEVNLSGLHPTERTQIWENPIMNKSPVPTNTNKMAYGV